jgi:amidase
MSRKSCEPDKLDIPEIVKLDAVELSSAIKSKRISSVEVMAAYLDHIDRANPLVNAIVSLQNRDDLLKQAKGRDEQLARGEYLGAMHGFPLAIKDLEPTKGIRTTLGSPLFKDYVPKTDSIVVERMKRAGGIVVGKTNVPEFGLGSNTYNNVFGATLNAYDQSKTCGGSSGGAAVDVFMPSLSVHGPMARTIPDLAMLLKVQSGYDPRVPLSIRQDSAIFSGPLERDFQGTRVAWLGDFGGYLPFEPGVLDLCKGSLKVFEHLGCIVEEALPDFPIEEVWRNWLKIRASQVGARFKEFYNDPAKRALMKPELQWEIQSSARLTADEVSEASGARSAWYQAVRRFFERYDYFVLPSAQVFPFDVSIHWPKQINGKAMDTYHRWMEIAVPVTMSGCPALNVPAGFNEQGLPMGIQIVAPNHGEMSCLQLAYAYNQATQWVIKRPPLLLSSK